MIRVEQQERWQIVLPDDNSKQHGCQPYCQMVVHTCWCRCCMANSQHLHHINMSHTQQFGRQQ